jgi:hypothetical protein
MKKIICFLLFYVLYGFSLYALDKIIDYDTNNVKIFCKDSDILCLLILRNEEYGAVSITYGSKFNEYIYGIVNNNNKISVNWPLIPKIYMSKEIAEDGQPIKSYLYLLPDTLSDKESRIFPSVIREQR